MIMVGCLMCGVVCCVLCVHMACVVCGVGGVCVCCGGACAWCVVRLGTLSLFLSLSLLLSLFPSSSLSLSHSLSFSLLSFFRSSFSFSFSSCSFSCSCSCSCSQSFSFSFSAFFSSTKHCVKNRSIHKLRGVRKWSGTRQLDQKKKRELFTRIFPARESIYTTVLSSFRKIAARWNYSHYSFIWIRKQSNCNASNL